MKEKNKDPKNKLRRIAGDILIALTLLLAADVTVIMLYRISSVVRKEVYKTVFIYELIILAVMIVLAFDIRFGFLTCMKRRGAKIAGAVVRTAVILFTAAILFFGCKAAFTGFVEDKESADHAIVLGMALENGEPTKDLLLRVDRAKSWLDKNPDGILILSGGNPDESGRTEAVIMRDLLTARGVSADSIVVEDAAEDTDENIKNASEFVSVNDSVALITNGYHMERAARIAKDAGFANVQSVPAPSDPVYYAANVMWEIVIDINDLIKS